MANNFDEGMAHATKGLSFIDWDSLEHDEYNKLSRIISTSNKSSGVQLLFVDDEPADLDNKEKGDDNNKEEQEEKGLNNDGPEVKEETPECDIKEKGVVVDVENSVLHPAAPVFQPSIPPPSIMPFPIPVPHHWAHADPNMPPQPQAGPYSYAVPGGYVFHHDHSLAAHHTHNGEATVAFVTLSNGQPAYAFPGHPIPAHHFQPTTLASGIPSPLPNAAAATHIPSQGDMLLHSVSGAVIPTTPSHHPLVFPPHIASTVGQPLPAHIVPPNTVSQHIPPHLNHHHHHHSTQFMYIPQQQMPPETVTSTESGNGDSHSCATVESNKESILVHSNKEKEEEKTQNYDNNNEENYDNNNKDSAIPKEEESPSMQLLCEIEFGGPVIFDVEPPVSNTSSLEKTPSKSPVKSKTKKSPSSVQQTPAKGKLPPPSQPKDKNTDVVIDSTSLSEASHERVYAEHVNNSNQESSVDSNQSSSVNAMQSPIVNEPSKSDTNSSSLSLNLPVNNMSPPSSDVHSSMAKEVRLPEESSKSSSSESENKSVADCTNNKPRQPVLAPAPKTWSSLFGKRSQSTPSQGAPVSTASEHSITNNMEASSNNSAPVVTSVRYWQEQDRQSEREKNGISSGKKIKAVDVRQDPLASKLLAKLSDFPISHIPIIVQPRGLKNGNNICFMNATLQVLMGCPPFIHLFRAFRNLPARSGGNSSTPVFDALVQFVNSFQNCQRVRQQGPVKSKKGNGYDMNVGVPFIPDSLLAVAQHILGLNIGVQHDAEEFLSQILSICNEEMEKIINMKNNLDSLNNNNGTATTTTTTKRVGNGKIHQNGDAVNKFIEDGDDDDSWVQVGPKNHCVETNVNNCGQTPLSAIFAGVSRCCLVRESGKTSDTLDSFFTLKLDIQADSVHSVKDALVRLNATEDVHDVCGKKVHGQRRMFFDVLPPVLIMHLKLFEYSNGNGQKIQKNISFDVDLQIPKEILSRTRKSKYAAVKSRNYKLFGVVNHHGSKMNDGHYTSDVFLPIVNGWLHFDDSDVSLSDETTVLQHVDKSMPYLLFYRRMDV